MLGMGINASRYIEHSMGEACWDLVLDSCFCLESKIGDCIINLQIVGYHT